MHLARWKSERGGFVDLVEIARHYVAVKRFDEAITWSFAVADVLRQHTGQLSVTAYLGEVVPLIPPEHVNYVALTGREIDALLAIGRLGTARLKLQTLLAESARRSEADPSNTQWQRDLSISYNKLGDLALATGDLPDAERAFRDSLVIRTRLAEADPSNTQWQRDLSVSYERLGAIAYFTKRLAQIQYATFQAAGYPIGSGSRESANKVVVEGRLKGSGMHWARAHVNPLVALRTVACADRWAEVWPGISARLRSEAKQLRPRWRARHPTPSPSPADVPPTPATVGDTPPATATLTRARRGKTVGR